MEEIFFKMNGAGNEFVILDRRARVVGLLTGTVKLISDASKGIGCDQLILLEPSDDCDVFMRIFNRDGSESGACGNAARCVSFLMMLEKRKQVTSLETVSGRFGAKTIYDENDQAVVEVSLGLPKFEWNEIPLRDQFHDTRSIELHVGAIDNPILRAPSCANLGNPHVVFWVDNMNQIDLEKIGPMLEYHPMFPDRVNVSIAEVKSRHLIEVKVWERGVGLTEACGSAAGAVACNAIRCNLAQSPIDIAMPGGTLGVRWEGEEVWLSGPTEIEYIGALDRGYFHGDGPLTDSFKVILSEIEEANV